MIADFFLNSLKDSRGWKTIDWFLTGRFYILPIMKYLIALMLINALFAYNKDKIMVLRKSDHEPRIDGFIDPVWQRADSIADFFQFRPYYGKDPSCKTVAKCLTSDEALFCLIIAFQNSESIEKKKGKLDDMGGDIVSLMLDTYQDQRTAYKFAVTATGVRADCRLLDDARNRDYSWDGIWFADTQIYDWGFVIEMKIPYKSIQYDQSLNSWGLDFDRWIANKSEDLYWCPFEQSEGQRVSRFGELRFENFKPSSQGLNLELYPLAISKTVYTEQGNYTTNLDLGFNAFYNPSPKLTFLLTINPDFAQIEADPFAFNISRYESYFEERRPFFTEGNEVFMPSGRLRNSGFYQPLELFYSRRIGKKLPDGQEVPLLMGSKAFGRLGDWEYGGFLSMTDQVTYSDEGKTLTEPRALFTSARLKRQILANSSIGMLFVSKHTAENSYGVFDLDGAFRTSSWQLAYQLAHSFDKDNSAYAGAAGFTMISDSWITFIRGHVIDEAFDAGDQISFVPWKGTAEFFGLSGPRWYMEEGEVQEILIYAGPLFYYEKTDAFTDYAGALGYNMQFRDNWGFEVNLVSGKARDAGLLYNFYEASFSSWFRVSPKWDANFYGSYSHTYNFSREYLSFLINIGGEIGWQLLNELKLGTTLDMFEEQNISGWTEEITWNARPFFSLIPVNNLTFRVYVDAVWLRSSAQLEQLIGGFLIAYNYSPKSWIYLAINEIREKDDYRRMRISDRVAVFKASYLYYF